MTYHFVVVVEGLAVRRSISCVFATERNRSILVYWIERLLPVRWTRVRFLVGLNKTIKITIHIHSILRDVQCIRDSVEPPP